ncbi:MAG: hypothetical protein WAW88_14580 [Nocardioides sp.]
MSWISQGASELGAQSIIDSLEPDDVDSGLASVVLAGWERLDGAHVLTAWSKSYHGDRSRFPSDDAYEYSVNGRGIPDQDLADSRVDRNQILLRRGLAFACAALSRSQQDLPTVTMLGQVSVTPTLFDPTVSTGHVTFYTAPADLSTMVIPADPMDVMVVLAATDCAKALVSSTSAPSAQRADQTALLELCRSGSPVVREDGVDEILEVARRRWQSFKRRKGKRTSDLGARTEDLAKGLRDHFEASPRLIGPLMEDYRYLAGVLAAEFSQRDVV